MAGAHSAWAKDKQVESARSPAKPPKTEQAMQMPKALKEAEATAAALRAEYRAVQANAAAEAQRRNAEPILLKLPQPSASSRARNASGCWTIMLLASCR